MPRQRMIKPDFFDSGSLAECTRDARLVFVGLWVMADDKGNMKFNERKLQKQLFPYDDLDPRMLMVWLAELEDVGCIKAYEAQGDVCISVPNFLTYQTIKNPSKTTVPEPPEGLKDGPRTDYFTSRSYQLWGITNPHIPPCFPPTFSTIGNSVSTIGNGVEMEDAPTTYPQLTPKVPPSKERSKEVISSSPFGEEEEITPGTKSEGASEFAFPASVENQNACPECGSEDRVEPKGEHLMACHACGAVWERGSAHAA